MPPLSAIEIRDPATVVVRGWRRQSVEFGLISTGMGFPRAEGESSPYRGVVDPKTGDVVVVFKLREDAEKLAAWLRDRQLSSASMEEVGAALGASDSYVACGKLLGEGQTCARREGHSDGECSPLPDKKGMTRVPRRTN